MAWNWDISLVGRSKAITRTVVQAVPVLADLPGVNAHPGFSQVLDDKLGSCVGADAPPAAEAFHLSSRIRGPWVFVDAGIPSSPRAARAAYASFESQRQPVPEETTTPPAPHVSSRLYLHTARERDALRRLRQLGAEGLGDVLWDADVKRAFRTLARRYHPDRHPGLTRDERRRFAALFTEVADAYRTLMAASRQ